MAWSMSFSRDWISEAVVMLCSGWLFVGGGGGGRLGTCGRGPRAGRLNDGGRQGVEAVGAVVGEVVAVRGRTVRVGSGSVGVSALRSSKSARTRRVWRKSRWAL